MINWKIKHELKNFIEDIENKNVLDFARDSRYRTLIENKYTGLDVRKMAFPETKSS